LSHLKDNDLTEIILEIINEEKPQSVRRLTEMLTCTLGFSEEEILKSVTKLQNEGIIKLNDMHLHSSSLSTYLKTSKAIWYWGMLTLAVMTGILVFAISENSYPLIYLRNVLGVMFVLFLPGYALVKAFFINDVHSKSLSNSLERVERVVVSIGMSIALVSIVGLVLYYSPLGLNSITITFSLLVFTIICATAAVIREYQSIELK
jgi:DNA-binding Lrp family transcriptional regulator